MNTPTRDEMTTELTGRVAELETDLLNPEYAEYVDAETLDLLKRAVEYIPTMPETVYQSAFASPLTMGCAGGVVRYLDAFKII